MAKEESERAEKVALANSAKLARYGTTSAYLHMKKLLVVPLCVYLCACPCLHVSELQTLEAHLSYLQEQHRRQYGEECTGVVSSSAIEHACSKHAFDHAYTCKTLLVTAMYALRFCTLPLSPPLSFPKRSSVMLVGG